MARTQTSPKTDRTKVSFEWYQNGKWMEHTPLIPTRAVQYAIRELKSQPDIIRNIHTVYGE